MIAACGPGGGGQGSDDAEDDQVRGEPVSLVEAAQFGRGRAVAAASDGTTLIVATTVGVVGTPVASPDQIVDYPTSLDAPLEAVSLASGGGAVFLQAAVGAAELWSAGPAPALLATLADVESGEFTDDGAVLLVATATTLNRLSVGDGSVVATVELPAGSEIDTVAWESATGEAMVLATGDSGATAWEWTADGELLPVDIGDTTGAERAVLDTARQRVLVETPEAGERFSGNLRAWDRSTSSELFTVDVGTGGGSARWAVGTDGQILTVDGSEIRLLDLDGQIVSSWLRRRTESVTSIVGLQNGSGFAVADAGGSVSLIDVEGRTTAVTPSDGRLLLDVAEFAGTPGIVTVDDQGRVRLWADDGTPLAAVDDYFAGFVREVAVSPAGDEVGFGTSAGNAGVLTLADDTTTAAGGSLPLPTDLAQTEGNIDTVRFTNDGASLLTGVSERNGDLSFDDTQTRWELAGPSRSFAVGGEVERVMGCMAYYNTIRVTPDGEAFVAPFHNFTVSLRNVDDGSLIHEFPAHKSSVLDVAISPDGELLVTAADDWTVRVWDLEDYTLVSEFETAPGGYRSIAFLPDGDALVTADISGVIRVLDLDDGSLSEPFAEGVSADSRIAVSPDGGYVAAGSLDGRVGVWTVEGSELVDQVEAHEDGVGAVTFTPDGAQVVSGSRDGTIKVWDLVPA